MSNTSDRFLELEQWTLDSKHCRQEGEEKTAVSDCLFLWVGIPKGYTLGVKDDTEVNRPSKGLQFSSEPLQLGHLQLD